MDVQFNEQDYTAAPKAVKKASGFEDLLIRWHLADNAQTAQLYLIGFAVVCIVLAGALVLGSMQPPPIPPENSIPQL